MLIVYDKIFTKIKRFDKKNLPSLLFCYCQLTRVRCVYVIKAYVLRIHGYWDGSIMNRNIGILIYVILPLCITGEAIPA